MDQDSTKNQADGGDRRNWRERLGVGQDLPKISDEFKQAHGKAKPADGESQPAPRPGTPVRPAPMAPRYSRSTATQPGNGSSSGTDAPGAKPSDPPRNAASPAGVKPWAPSQPANGQASARPGHTAPTPPLPEAQRPAPGRGPAAYPQAAERPGAQTTAARNDSFGERLRAQRDAAEKLAQQRLAAARDRSGQASADALAMLTPRKAEEARQAPETKAPETKAQPKPAGGEQPRFTFAQEEIAAAQQETEFSPTAPPSGVHQQPPAAPPQSAPQTPPLAEDSEPNLYPPHETPVARTPEQVPEHQPDYRHEDDGMFEDEQPGLHVEPPRASAADYSAAYREFEDEFEDDEPRRGKGPLLLLVSLAAVAVISGGLIYGYQQMQGPAPAAEPANLPVVAAPEEPAKSDPVAEEQPEEAAVQPTTTRKQIYDRIIGEETLEPERIVPTEEEPLRQIQQPRASGDGRSGVEDQSTEPLPMPEPPPPGTGAGEQGDLLVPGMAATQTALAPPAPAQLSLPAPGMTTAAAGETADAPVSRMAESQAETADRGPASTAAEALKRAKAAPEPETAAPVRTSIYPDVTEPLAYPTARAERSEAASPHDSVGEPDGGEIAALPEPRAYPTVGAERSEAAPPHDSAGEPDEGEIAALPEPRADETAQAEPEVKPVAVTEAEPEAERASDVPLPRAKPEPPVRTAAAQAPEPQPQRQAAPQPSSSGPVQIIPTDETSTPLQRPSARAALQPEAQPAPRRRVGPEPDPYAGPNANSLSKLLTGSGAAAPQQVASVSPDAPTAQGQPDPSQSAQSQSDGSYVVQLASFRSKAAALAEYQRLAQRHPNLMGGLDSRIQEASLGQSGSFYRLGVGPLGERSAATKLCNALIAAGEKDCLVRRN